MAQHFASGLYKLSITLLVFSCLGLVFSFIGLISSNQQGARQPYQISSKAISLVAYSVQIAVCALGIYGAKTYRATHLTAGAVLCGIVVAFDLVLIIIAGITVGIIRRTIAGGGEPLVVALAVILLIFSILFFILYLIEFILLIKHAKRARAGHPSETTYVKV